jgi:Ca-activated chloride channel family protein
MVVLGEHGEALRPVALTGVRVRVELRGLAARTVLTQTFRNTETVPIEALYCFPLEEGSTVCAMRVRAGGRTLVAIAEEKEKAFKSYDDAMAAGHGAYLLDMERQDILALSAGNLTPGQEAEVEIVSVAALPVADGVRRFQLPTTVSPRYAPAGADPVDIDRISPPVMGAVPYRLQLEVRVLSEPGLEIRSPSHEITIGDAEGWRVVTLAREATELDRDFILETVSAASQVPQCLVSRHANGERAALLRLFPELDVPDPAAAQPPLEVVFMVDCSGSMQGSSIEEARKTLDLSLRAMSEGDRFNIVRFGSSMVSWQPAPAAYNTRTFDQAVSWVKNMEADLGGTELLPAFQQVSAMPLAAGAHRDVILITDGEVSNPDEVLGVATAHRGRQRVFSFGIGYGASSHLVKGVARASGGASEMIQPGEKIQPQVLRQFSRLGQAMVEGLAVHFSGVKVEVAAADGTLPPLFEGDSFVVFARVWDVAPGAEVELTGKVGGRPYSWKAPLTDLGQDDTIPCLWARQRIRMLQEGEAGGTGGSNQSARRTANAAAEIVELGIKYNLLTDATSFVAIEERDLQDRTTERAQMRRVPIMLTKDWHGTDSMINAAAPAGYASMEMAKARQAPSGMGRAKKDMRLSPLPMRADMAFGEELSRKSMPQEDPWYFRLLATQDSEGAFEGFEILAEVLGKKVRELEKLAASLEGTDKALRQKALATWLSVMLLKKDADAAVLSKRAVQKAEKWLAKNAASLTVNGQPLAEYWK